MAMRLSGLMSGMDTETIISQLVEARKSKVTKAVKAQKSLKVKQDTWKSLNTQIKKLYDGALGNLRWESSYMKKTTKVSNSSVVSVITGENAMNSVQSLRVDHLAKSGFLTGGEIAKADGGKVTGDTTLKDLGMMEGDSGRIRVNVGGEIKDITLTSSTKVSEFVRELQRAGLTANFDEKNQRFYVASKTSGTQNDFMLSAQDGTAFSMLEKLGLSYCDDALKKSYQDIVDGRDDTVKSRVKETLGELTSQRNGALTKQNDLMTNLRKYRTELAAKGIDVDDVASYSTDAEFEALDTAINEVISDAEAALPEGDETLTAMKKELSGWTDSWRSNESALSEVESKLDIDADGKVAGLAASEVAAIEAKTNLEVTRAQNVLDILNNAPADSFKGSKAKAKAQDAEIYLNDVRYTSDRNTFEINNLTLTVNAETALSETVTLTTQDDTDGIYDMVKNFFKEYNALINQMDKLYNADSAKGYEPLTDEEKDAMSDSEIEEWENKVKDSILRRDDTLGSFASAMKQIMLSGVVVDGKKMYLSEFGINTLNYFSAADNEKNAYHIDGDSDDENTAGNEDKLRKAIAADPEKVMNFFVGLSRELYSKMTDMMAGSEYSSAYTAYDDKKMKTDYDNYTKKIKDLEKELADYEDKWYAKFAAMETAMAKMQKNVSAVTALIGGSV